MSDHISEPEVPPLSRSEMNDILEREGLSVRVRENDIPIDVIPHPRDVPSVVKNRGQISLYSSHPKVETIRGGSRDRSLTGKARRKARKGG